MSNFRFAAAFTGSVLFTASSFALINGTAPETFYQYVGVMNGGFCATPISSTWIVTARHIAPSVGTIFSNTDGNFTIDQVVLHPDADFALAHVSTTMSHFYQLAQNDITNSLSAPGTGPTGPIATFIGNGPTASATATGWAPGSNGGTIRESHNRIEGQDDVSFTNSAPFFKALIYDLDGNNVSGFGPYDPLSDEGGLVGGDSGGSWFVTEGGVQKVIAVSSGVYDNFDNTGYGSGVTASTPTNDPAYYDYGDGGFGCDLAAYQPFINSTINATPEPATLAALGLGVVALMRKRRR